MISQDKKSLEILGFFSVFPACAGVSPNFLRPDCVRLSFPRVCGGEPKICYNGRWVSIVFPACAGVSLTMPLPAVQSRRFPRVCGGEPKSETDRFSFMAFSPRVRG